MYCKVILLSKYYVPKSQSESFLYECREKNPYCPVEEDGEKHRMIDEDDEDTTMPVIFRINHILAYPINLLFYVYRIFFLISLHKKKSKLSK